ncbi:MAG: hypothetical protein C0511_07605 [Hyphomicrobium sp.]|nr:hypothetical protein [Hyphomicrobium sp.]
MGKPKDSPPASIFADRTTRSDLDVSPEIAKAAASFCDLLGKRITEISPGAIVTLGNITAAPLSSVLGERMAFGVMLVAKMANPAGNILFQLDGRAVDKWVDRLLGGDGGAGQPRNLSAVDARLCRLLLDQALGTFAQALYHTGHNPGLEVESVASDPAKIPALRQLQNVVMIEALVGSATSAVTLRVLIPEALCASLRDKIAKEQAAGTDSPVDRNWVTLIEQQVASTSVEVCSVLTVANVDLGEVLQWKVGQILPLDARKGALVSLESANMPLAMCELGRHAERLVLRIWSTAEEDFPGQEADQNKAVSPGQARAHILNSLQ